MMRNRFFEWLQVMGLGGYTLKFTGTERNASMTVLQNVLIRDYDMYCFITKRRDVGAVYVTASCGCEFLIERDENYTHRVCDAHYMLSIIEEARSDTATNY